MWGGCQKLEIPATGARRFVGRMESLSSTHTLVRRSSEGPTSGRDLTAAGMHTFTLHPSVYYAGRTTAQPEDKRAV